jgi:hypothetical protein
MTIDSASPRCKLLDVASLLYEARSIERDLSGRLFQHPKNKSLLKQRKQYRQLVRQLAFEFERALASDSTSIKAAAGPAAEQQCGRRNPGKGEVGDSPHPWKTFQPDDQPLITRES